MLKKVPMGSEDPEIVRLAFEMATAYLKENPASDEAERLRMGNAAFCGFYAGALWERNYRNKEKTDDHSETKG